MGYRLIRSSELERERTAAAAAVENARVDLRNEVDHLRSLNRKLDHDLEVAGASIAATMRDAHKRETDLLEQLAAKQGALQAALTHADLVTVRVNVLEHEVSQFRQLARPEIKQMVPAVGKAPIGAGLVDGANADLFGDVGDAEAERLRSLNMLHDIVPAGEDLTPIGAAALVPAGFPE